VTKRDSESSQNMNYLKPKKYMIILIGICTKTKSYKLDLNAMTKMQKFLFKNKAVEQHKQTIPGMEPKNITQQVKSVCSGPK
jgi:hypothetical protein